MAEPGTARRIGVVPHFMRLHEWIALEEGFFAAEGLEPDLRPDVMHRVSSHARSDYFRRPQDVPFFEAAPVANSACEWGSVCNAGAGMGKFVPELYGVARFTIFARRDAGLRRLTDLRGVPVGVGLMAGSHFTTLRTLEGVLPREHIRIENVGGPGRRLLALREGEVAAATLLDPEIPLARRARGVFRRAAPRGPRAAGVAGALHAVVGPERAARARGRSRLHALRPGRAPGIRAVSAGDLRPDDRVRAALGPRRQYAGGRVRSAGLLVALSG
jgi:hypothetical protein